MITLSVGDVAPDFDLPDQDGVEHALSDYRDRWIILYFYPQDDTPGCTTQACGLRDNMNRLSQLEPVVLGVSVDSVHSHKKFAHKYHLTFTLLADEQKQVVKMYGVWGDKKFMGKQYQGTMRTTFIIDPDGKIARIYEKVDPGTHFTHLEQDLPGLQQDWLTAKHSSGKI